MLIHLHVKNLALIEEIDVDFGPGLNILTGETGAGKTILLNSMQLILGGKFSRSMLRENAPFALVEMLFQVEGEKTLLELSSLGIDAPDHEVLFSRRIADGRSVGKINGEMCTLSQMKAAAALLLDIHGQHEHQSLLYPEKQLAILDAYGGEEVLGLKEEVQESYKAYRKAKKALEELDIDEERRSREISFLQFEIQQIDEAALYPGEDEKLEKQFKKLSAARKIDETLQQAAALLGYDSGALDLIGSASKEMLRAAAYDEDLSPLSDQLSEAESLLADFHRGLSAYLDDLTFDEEAFSRIGDRLDLINNLKGKYGGSIEKILEGKEERERKLDILLRHEEHLLKARAEVKEAEKVLKKASLALEERRKAFALSLEERIVAALKDLNFLDVRFRIRFDRKKSYSDNGIDDIEYEIATNPGEEPKGLSGIVSGGELSRIMLAIKAILADRDQIETLIFDEIDTGISGRTAQRVSEKMAEIGRHRQVICITHLPQIASMADQHFEIEKHVLPGGATVTEIHPLSEEDQVRELGRLLGGASITDAVLLNAREMKKLASDKKAEKEA